MNATKKISKKLAPESTASRLEKNNAKIDSVTRMAIEVFGNEQSAIEWMRQPNPMLGDTAPLNLMDTKPGAILVRQLLNAIGTGGVA